MGIKKFGTLCLVAFATFIFTDLVDAAFNFSSRESRIKVVDTNAKLVVNTAITGYDGTLEIVDNAADRIQGTATITFDEGMLESGDIHAFFTGVYDPATTDKIMLEGSHRLRAEAGTVLPAVEIGGTSNTIEGMPRFSSAITMRTDAAALSIGMQNKLNQNITLNGATVTLIDNLGLEDDVLFTGSGRVNLNGYALNMPGQTSSWTSTVSFNSASDIELHAYTYLTGMFIFDGSGPAVVNGNGNVLDLTNGGTLWVKNGYGVALTDIVIKGLGTGFFVFEDANSTFSLNNVTIHLDANYTVTQGSWYAYGGDCKIVTYDKILTFDEQGTFSIDGITVYYDPLTSPDINNVRPYEEDNTNLEYLNGGLLSMVPVGGAGADLVYDVASNTLLNNEDLGGGRIMNFRGNTDNDMTLDGNGMYVHFPRGVSNVVTVADGKTATFTDIVLKDFSPAHVQLGTGSAIYFGASVTIELAENIDLNTTWTFNAGSSTISGQGSNLLLNHKHALIAMGDATLNLENMRMTGLSGSAEDFDDTAAGYIASANKMRCVVSGSKITARDVEFVLSSDYTFTCGTFDIYDDVAIEGAGHKFVYTSPNDLTIKTDATLLMDRGTTFSYNSTAGAAGWKEHLVFEDASARFFLNGCTLHSTLTGMKLQTGTLVISDLVSIESEATDAQDAMVIDSGLNVQVLAGATMDLDGMITYE